MAIMNNLDKNILLMIDFIANDLLDTSSKNDFEKWIPFKFKLISPLEIYTYDEDSRCTFSYYELNNLILGMKKACFDKRQNIFSPFSFCCLERYFEILLTDTLEPESIYFDIWINIGTYTSGKIYGYERGIRFVVSLDEVIDFAEKLEGELKNIIS